MFDFLNPRDLGRLAVLLFLAILFIQSGLSKILDYSGNLEYIRGVFSKTFLAPMVGLMFPLLTLLETLTGLVCAVAAVALTLGEARPALLGLALAALALLSLFKGLRIAGDYPGAASLAAYFAVVLVGFVLFSIR